MEERRDVPDLLCVSVARTQVAITGAMLPEDRLVFNQSKAGGLDSFTVRLQPLFTNTYSKWAKAAEM